MQFDPLLFVFLAEPLAVYEAQADWLAGKIPACIANCIIASSSAPFRLNCALALD